MKASRSHSLNTRIRPALGCLIAGGLLISSLVACSSTRESAAPQPEAPANRPAAAGSDASRILERYRALDNSRDSTVRLRARVTPIAEVEPGAPGQLQLTIYRKRAADGRILILVEFTAPPEERDRDGLITVFADGRIEGVRYVQSTDSFIVTDDPLSEDALFGLTLQELADGQPEKYEFTVAGEESNEGTPAYRLEGNLKRGAQSKFPRLMLLIDKQNFTAARAEFYDNHNELARRLDVSKVEQIAGYWTRERWTIDNRARQKTIDFEVTEARYDQNLRDSIFTREHLKKLASR